MDAKNKLPKGLQHFFTTISKREMFIKAKKSEADASMRE